MVPFKDIGNQTSKSSSTQQRRHKEAAWDRNAVSPARKQEVEDEEQSQGDGAEGACKARADLSPTTAEAHQATVAPARSFRTPTRSPPPPEAETLICPGWHDNGKAPSCPELRARLAASEGQRGAEESPLLVLWRKHQLPGTCGRTGTHHPGGRAAGWQTPGG